MHRAFWILPLLVATLAATATPVMRVLNVVRTGTPLLQNGDFEDAREQSLAQWSGVA